MGALSLDKNVPSQSGLDSEVLEVKLAAMAVVLWQGTLYPLPNATVIPSQEVVSYESRKTILAKRSETSTP